MQGFSSRKIRDVFLHPPTQHPTNPPNTVLHHHRHHPATLATPMSQSAPTSFGLYCDHVLANIPQRDALPACSPANTPPSGYIKSIDGRRLRDVCAVRDPSAIKAKIRKRFSRRSVICHFSPFFPRRMFLTWRKTSEKGRCHLIVFVPRRSLCSSGQEWGRIR